MPVSDLPDHSTDDTFGRVHVQVVEFLAVFPAAMNERGAFSVTSLDLVVKLLLVILVVREEARDAVPQSLAHPVVIRVKPEK